MREATAKVGWTDLMPVQSKAIPYILAGRDLMVQSRTGSGKTGAFMLPILEKIDPNLNACQALVMVPTRELARQVAREGEILGSVAGVRTAAVYGGVKYGPQMKALSKGAHIVVGTPGRVLDHLLKKTFTLDDIEFLVFDEADRMLSVGFYPDMKQVKQYLPKRPVHGLMFSATFPGAVKRLAHEFLRNPEFLSLSRDHVHVTDTEHAYYVVPGMEKERSLVRIIEVVNPGSAIIFCNTKAQVHFVTTVLQRFGYNADELTADLKQATREAVLARVRKGSLRFLVATDLAARGIDIPELSHVIQYEPPEDPESYVHRAGRTGRAGASGEAISLVAGMEQTEMIRIGKRFGIDLIERPVPTEEDVETLVAARVTALLEAQIRERGTLHAERMQRFVPLARELSQHEDELSLITMLLDDYYQQTLHGNIPEPPPTPSREPGPRKGSGGRTGRSRKSGRRRRDRR
jgi:ATP-dependent RNA helicase DeaD